MFKSYFEKYCFHQRLIHYPFQIVLTELRVADMLLLLLTSIATTTSHTSHAALNTYQQFGIATEAPDNRYFFARCNIHCVLSCINGYSPLLMTNSKLAFCWTAAIYRSHDSQCWCHNDTAEFPLRDLSTQPSFVLMLMPP